MNVPIDPAVFENILRENGIPPRPAVLETISIEMRKDEPDMRVIERAVSRDVAISGGLIRMANSPFFGTQRHVRSVVEAMQLLGLRATAQAVACIVLRNTFPNLKLARFWDASAQIATLSAWLVQQYRWKDMRSEDAYTLGLFRDCGIAILLQRIPSYVEVLHQANTEAVRGFTEVEEEVLPVAHTQIGAMMTQTWWLPDEITEAIRHHHDPDAISGAAHEAGLGSNSGALIAVVQLAEHLFQSLTGLSATCEWAKLGNACLARLQIDSAELAELQQRIAVQEVLE
jgi:HD-like signal output (HDOD) protein